VPKDDRKIHGKPMPVLGGLGILVSILLGSLLIPGLSLLNNVPFVLGAILITLLGMVDDKYELRAIYKLLGQIIIAVMFVLMSTQHLQVFVFGDLYISIPPVLSLAFSVV
jgi:UDP-GlcNAc:undecaprenyl-phosphate/decaprenyl-phosphate GlcNAc-1-phosphate transferase